MGSGHLYNTRVVAACPGSGREELAAPPALAPCPALLGVALPGFPVVALSPQCGAVAALCAANGGGEF